MCELYLCLGIQDNDISQFEKICRQNQRNGFIEFKLIRISNTRRSFEYISTEILTNLLLMFDRLPTGHTLDLFYWKIALEYQN